MNRMVRVLVLCPSGRLEPAWPPAELPVDCTVVGGLDSLLAHLSRSTPDVVSIHVDTEFELNVRQIGEIRELAPAVPILLIAPASATRVILQAAQAGIDCFLPAPVDPVRMAHQVMALAPGPHRDLPSEPSASSMEMLLLGHSPEIERVRRTMALIADTDVTVLLHGESGTGKEVAARCLWLHSRRASAGFVKINCAAIPHDLLESELFGYEAGAFTGAVRPRAGKFELAHRGTIFLDEISELHPLLQAKLLHVLQDGEFCRLGGRHNLTADVRVIAATNADLEQAVACGRFRQDLYYRLNVVSLRMPSLRQRPDDIPLLLDHFLARYAELYRRPLRPFQPETRECLMRYCWPGNVRELENIARRMIVLGDESEILADLRTIPARLGFAGIAGTPLPALVEPVGNGSGRLHGNEVETGRPPSLLDRSRCPGMPLADAHFPPAAGPSQARHEPQEATAAAVNLASVRSPDRSLLEIGRQAAMQAETEAILQVLQQTRWNRRQAARILQVSYKALQNKLKSMKLAGNNVAVGGANSSLRPQ